MILESFWNPQIKNPNDATDFWTNENFGFFGIFWLSQARKLTFQARLSQILVSIIWICDILSSETLRSLIRKVYVK